MKKICFCRRNYEVHHNIQKRRKASCYRGENAKDAFVKEARKSLGVKAMKSKVVKECSSLEDGPFTFEVSNGESSEYFELEDR